MKNNQKNIQFGESKNGFTVIKDSKAFKLQKLISIGRLMRSTQKEYFQTRSQSSLLRSKDLESQFDNLVSDLETPNLFE